MTKSQLVVRIAQRAMKMARRDVDAVVDTVFEVMTDALRRGERIEIRGFGSFAVRARPAREGRNPKSGKRVSVPPRRVTSFTIGKELHERLNRPTAAASVSSSVGGARAEHVQPMAARGAQ